MNVPVSVARLYRGHLYPRLRRYRGATALLRWLDARAYRTVLAGTRSREFGFEMETRDDFVPLIYERPVVDAFVAALGPDTTVFDVGSFHGFYALLAATQTGAGIYAFEPDADNRDRLVVNVDLNPDVSDVTVVPKAVLDENGETTYAPSGGKTTVGMGDRTVSSVTLDSFCAREDVTPDVLKIDVEGAEGCVLSGATDVLRERPTLFVEIHEDPRHDFERSVRDRLSGFDIEVLMRRESEVFIRAE